MQNDPNTLINLQHQIKYEKPEYWSGVYRFYRSMAMLVGSPTHKANASLCLFENNIA